MASNDYSGFEEEPDPQSQDLLNKLCDQLGAVDAEIQNLENQLEERKAARTEIAERQLPNLMISLGVKDMTTLSGTSIELKEEVRASFFSKDPARRGPAFDWLKEKNHDGIIKNLVTVTYAKGEESEADWLVDLLKTAQVANVQRKRDIHHSTLLAFLRERIREDGIEKVPLDLFGAMVQKFAKVKRG